MVQTLNTEGFLFLENAGEWAVLSTDAVDGFEEAKLTGSEEGTRAWSVRIDLLPDDMGQVPGLDMDPGFLLLEDNDHLLLEAGGALLLDTVITRAQYLWRFFKTSQAAGDEPFWIEVEDPDAGEHKLFLASFVDHKLSYAVLCAKLYSTGLQLRQRRLPGVTSPLDV